LLFSSLGWGNIVHEQLLIISRNRYFVWMSNNLIMTREIISHNEAIEHNLIPSISHHLVDFL
jgi:hypothetical protein